MRGQRRWGRRLGLGGTLGALTVTGVVSAVRYDVSSGAATPLLVIGVLLFLTALLVGALVLIYAVLKSTRMTRNLVAIIKALRAKWE